MPDANLYERRNRYYHLAAGDTGTFVIKEGAGVLVSLLMGTPASGSLVMYDNTAASGDVIMDYSTPSFSQALADLDLPFSTGLTVVKTGASDITIIYL